LASGADRTAFPFAADASLIRTADESCSFRHRRGVVLMKDVPASRSSLRRLARRLTFWVAVAAEKVSTAAVPFKIGDVVLGDDPFNGRQLGVVAVIRGTSLGLRTSGDGRPDLVPELVYYDYRQVRTPD
jgi:hypothetical protein